MVEMPHTKIKTKLRTRDLQGIFKAPYNHSKKKLIIRMKKMRRTKKMMPSSMMKTNRSNRRKTLNVRSS